MLESALNLLPDDDSNERALLLATLCSELALGTTLERRKELADAARAMARRLGDPSTVVRTLNLVCDPLQVPSTLSERLVDAREALELADGLDDPDLRFWTSSYARLAAAQAGDFDWARRCLDTMRSVVSGLRQPGIMWVTLFNEVAEEIMTGDHERAEQLAAAALEVGTESGQPDALSFYGAEMIGVRSQQGRLGELVPLIEQMTADNPDLTVFRATLAAGYLQAGDTERSSPPARRCDIRPRIGPVRRPLGLRVGQLCRGGHRVAGRGTGATAARASPSLRRSGPLHRCHGGEPRGLPLRRSGVRARRLRRGRPSLHHCVRAQHAGRSALFVRPDRPPVGPDALRPCRRRRSGREPGCCSHGPIVRPWTAAYASVAKRAATALADCPEGSTSRASDRVISGFPRYGDMPAPPVARLC